MRKLTYMFRELVLVVYFNLIVPEVSSSQPVEARTVSIIPFNSSKLADVKYSLSFCLGSEEKLASISSSIPSVIPIVIHLAPVACRRFASGIALASFLEKN